MPEDSAIIVRNGIVITFGKDSKVLSDVSILVAGGVIQSIDSGEAILEKSRKYKEIKTIDAKNCVVTPGLINAHMHLYSTFACGIRTGVSRNFPEILNNLWWRLDNALTLEDIRLSALVPTIRCVKSGVTTIIDHHASYGAVTGSLGVVADAIRHVGIRGCLAYEVSDRHGEKKTEEAIEENVSFIRSLKDRKDKDLCAMFGLHASFTLSEKTLKRCLEKGDGVGFHVHCAEDISDCQDAKQQGFMGAADRLLSLGILREGSIAAHCIHVSSEEMERLAESKVFVVTNPQSNMNNAVGVADVPNLLKKNCIVGLGSDGMTANILEEMKGLILTQRQRSLDPTIMFAEAVEILTKINPEIASMIFKQKIGVLEEGFSADIVVWDYDPPTPLETSNWMGHMVFGIPTSRPKAVIVSGKIVMEEGKLLNIDEKVVYQEARRLASELWKRW